MTILTEEKLVNIIKDTVIYSSDISKIEAVMEVLAALRNEVDNTQNKEIYTKAIMELFNRTVFLKSEKDQDYSSL